MPNIPIIGEHRDEEPKPYDDLSPEDAARLEQMAAQENPEDHYDTVATAFTVVCDRKGEWSLSTSVNLPIHLEREATAADFVAGMSVALSDVQSHIAALKTQAVIVQMQQQLQRQVQEQQIKSRLNLKK